MSERFDPEALDAALWDALNAAQGLTVTAQKIGDPGYATRDDDKLMDARVVAVMAGHIAELLAKAHDQTCLLGKERQSASSEQEGHANG